MKGVRRIPFARPLLIGADFGDSLMTRLRGDRFPNKFQELAKKTTMVLKEHIGRMFQYHRQAAHSAIDESASIALPGLGRCVQKGVREKRECGLSHGEVTLTIGWKVR
jgi:hypothetical protein